MRKTAVTRSTIFRRDNYCCVYCGKSAIHDNVKLHADHLTPFSKGGSNKVQNIVTACSECNLDKKDRELTIEKRKEIRDAIYYRNIELQLGQETSVTGVRTRETWTPPAKVYSIRLNQDDVAYCEKFGVSVSRFIHLLLEMHKESKQHSKEIMRRHTGKEDRERIATKHTAKKKEAVKRAENTHITKLPRMRVSTIPDNKIESQDKSDWDDVIDNQVPKGWDS